MQCQRCSSRRQHAAQHLDNKQDHFLLSPLGRAVRRSVEQWSFPSCCDYPQAHFEAAAWDVFPRKRLTTKNEKFLHDKLDDDWVDEDEQEECLETRHRMSQLQNGSKSRGYYEQLYYGRGKRSDRTVKRLEDPCLEIEDGVVEEDLRERIELLFSMPLAGDQGSDSEELLGIKPEDIENDLKVGDLLLKTTSSDEYLVNNQMNMNGILDHDQDEMTARGNRVAKQNPYVSFVRKSGKGFTADFLHSYPLDQSAEGLLENTRGNEIGKESPKSEESEEIASCQEEKEKKKMISSERPDDLSKSLDTISEFSDSESLFAGSEIGKEHVLDLSQVDSKPNEQEITNTDLQSLSSKKSADSKTESSSEIRTPKFNAMKKTKIGTKKTKTVQNKYKRDTKKSVPKNNLDNRNMHKINSYLDNLKETTVLRLFQSHLQTKCSAGLNSQLIFKFEDLIE